MRVAALAGALRTRQPFGGCRMTQANADPLQTVWDALERADCRPVGPTHKFRARCPAHGSDVQNSLAVSVGADGRALLWCFVGCEAHDVVRALGLVWSDCFPPGHRHARQAGALSRKRLRPIDNVLGALRHLRIDYRCTRDPQMWVAAACPACGTAGAWPLWIHEHERGKVALSCFNGCAD